MTSPLDAEDAYALFRLAQRTFGAAPWEVAPAVGDRDLVAEGWTLAGPWRDVTALNDGEQELLGGSLVRRVGELSPAELGVEKALLARCPYVRFVPPLDLDVRPGVTLDEVLEVAQRLDAACARLGLGRPAWRTTGSKAGVHGDQLAPAGLAHPDLLLAYRLLVADRLAPLVGIPLLSDHVQVPEPHRPPVLLDDTLFARAAAGRGVMWRLEGAARPNGRRKLPVDLGDGLRVDPVPADERVIREALDLVRLEREHEDTRIRQRRVRVAGHGSLALPRGCGALTRVADVARRGSPPPNSGRHRYVLALAGWLLGAGIRESLVTATLLGVRDEDSEQETARLVSDTARRRADGQSVTGLGWIARTLAGATADALEEALADDLSRAGVEPVGVVRALEMLASSPPGRELGADEVTSAIQDALSDYLRGGGRDA